MLFDEVGGKMGGGQFDRKTAGEQGLFKFFYKILQNFNRLRDFPR